VPAAAAGTMYGYLLSCTTAPSVCLLLYDARVLQCPPRSLRILCDCEYSLPFTVDLFQPSTPPIHGLPLFELLCERCFIVVTRVDVSSSEVAHTATHQPSQPFELPAQPRSTTDTSPPFGLLPNHLQPDRHADNFDTRIGCFVRFTNCASSTTSLFGSAERVAAGRDVPAAAAENMYESLLYCTMALPLFCFLCCDDRALHCPPRSSGILCECVRVDYLSLSTSFNEPHFQVHGLPVLE
jgi:hypothetical protein